MVRLVWWLIEGWDDRRLGNKYSANVERMRKKHHRCCFQLFWPV